MLFLARYKVIGKSMLPNFSPGTTVFVSALPFLFKNPKKNDVVLVQDPRDRRPLLKRIAKVENKKYFVVGDNYSQSTDSRQFGMISRKHILGKVIGRLE